MNSWELGTLDLKPRLPEILSSNDAARAIVFDLAAGESLSEREVHERSWLVVLGGEIEVAAAAGDCASWGAGLPASLPSAAAGPRPGVREFLEACGAATGWPSDCRTRSGCVLDGPGPQRAGTSVGKPTSRGSSASGFPTRTRL